VTNTVKLQSCELLSDLYSDSDKVIAFITHSFKETCKVVIKCCMIRKINVGSRTCCNYAKKGHDLAIQFAYGRIKAKLLRNKNTVSLKKQKK
jgi:hypothetical protein